MKSIEKCSIQDLLKNELGTFMPIREIGFCLNSLGDNQDVVRKFFRECYEMSNNEIIKYIDRNKNLFNKPKFVLLNYLYLAGIKENEESILSKLKNINSKIQMEKLEEMRKYIIKHPTILELDDEKGLYDSRDYTTSEQQNEHKKDIEEAENRIRKIADKVFLQHITTFYSGYEAEQFYSSFPEIPLIIRQNMCHEIYGRMGYSEDQILQMLQGLESFPDVDPDEKAECFAKQLCRYREYIDWDKFLLTGAYLAKKYINDIPEKEIEDVSTKVMLVACELIKDEKTTITGRDINDDGKIIRITYTVKQLKKDFDENYIDGIYYHSKRKEELKSSIISGEEQLKYINSPKILKLLKLSEQELESLVEQNQENVIYLFENNIINENMFKKYANTHILQNETIERILGDGEIFSSTELLNLYYNGNISLEVMTKHKEIFEKDITEKGLIELYKKLENSSEEEKSRIEKYFALYRETKINQANTLEKEEIGNNIVLELGDDMEESDFFELYKRNLITINNLIEWNGETIVTEMFSKGLLKPYDMKLLVSEEKINLDEIKNTLQSKDLSDEEKMTLIFTTFDREEDEATRKKLLQTLTISTDLRNDSNLSGKQQNPEKEIKYVNRYLLDPCYKMQLLMLVDKDYNYSLTKDGHLILELPNLNKVIIEKMFRKTHGNVEIADGAATYILNADEFNSSNSITLERKINRSKLYEMCKSERAKRYYHTKTWGEMIKEEFDIERSSRYNEETKGKIDSTIEKIRRTRKLKEFR